MTIYTLNRCKYNIGIRSTGIYTGEKVITNHDLEKISDTTDEWIYSHTGIRERRVVNNDISTSDMMVKAGEMALERGGISPSSIDLLVVATLSPDNQNPATSALVQNRLGLTNACSFDINVGSCPASIYGLVVGGQFILNGHSRNVLVLVGDVISRLVNWNDRNNNYFFGDAAGAYLLGRTSNDRGLISYHLGTDGSGYDNIIIPAGGSRNPCTHDVLDKRLNCANVSGKKVKEFAVPTLCNSVNEVLKSGNCSLEDIDFIISHQANARLIEEAFKIMECPISKTYINIEKYGNTGGASVPLALHEACEKSKIKVGDNVILVSFGAGFQWGSTLLKWCGPDDFIG